jgi:hypothetical protein
LDGECDLGSPGSHADKITGISEEKRNRNFSRKKSANLEMSSSNSPMRDEVTGEHIVSEVDQASHNPGELGTERLKKKQRPTKVIPPSPPRVKSRSKDSIKRLVE